MGKVKHKVREVVFNLYQLPAGNPDYVYADDPILQLDEFQIIDDTASAVPPTVEEQFIRRGERAERLAQKGLLTDQDTMFGDSINWSFREYAVRNLLVPPSETQSSNLRPPQPVGHNQRHARVSAAQTIRDESPSNDQRLCLFNVIVALEWYPTRKYLEQLEWGFRRASDFLYDVTDGRMAFGQVIFGGPELLDCADVQILVSSRLQPRSWVGGLTNEHKYTPIRLGRGLWPSRNGVVVPWDEPEGYRTLVHEWAHYALGLRDEYLETIALIKAADVPELKARHVDEQVLVRSNEGDPDKLIWGTVRMATTGNQSIMASLEGTSELAPHRGAHAILGKGTEWDQIREVYTWLSEPNPPLAGPGRLPLPLPRMRSMRSLEEYLNRNSQIDLSSDPHNPVRFARDDLVLTADQMKMEEYPKLKHFTLYTLCEHAGGRMRFSAQGAPDARFQSDGFRLLGVDQGDTIVLVGSKLDGGPPIVYKSVISAVVAFTHPNTSRARRTSTQPDELRVVLSEWTPVTPQSCPTIDVVPHLEAANALAFRESNDAGTRARVSVRLSVPEGQQLIGTIRARIFVPGVSEQNGAAQAIELVQRSAGAHVWESESVDVPALDGHVFVQVDDQWMVSTYSHGGNPPSGGPHAPTETPPITAGSSDGGVKIFFRYHNPQKSSAKIKQAMEKYSAIKIVTTIDNGARALPLEKRMETLPAVGAQPCGYPFTIASNRPLPGRFNPTLEVQPQHLTDRQLLSGNLLLCRWGRDSEGSEHWLPQPSYLPSTLAFVAAPLTAESAGGLVEARIDGDITPEYAGDPIVQHYQLFWVPRR